MDKKFSPDKINLQSESDGILQAPQLMLSYKME